MGNPFTPAPRAGGALTLSGQPSGTGSGMTRLWLGIAIGSSGASHAQPAGTRCVSLAARDPMARALMSMRCDWPLGARGVYAECPFNSVPTTLCNVVLVAHHVGGLALDIAPV